MAKVVRIQDVAEEKALENLNRLTGLEFDTFPVSLVNPSQEEREALDTCDGGTKIARTINGLHK